MWLIRRPVPTYDVAIYSQDKAVETDFLVNMPHCDNSPQMHLRTKFVVLIHHNERPEFTTFVKEKPVSHSFVDLLYLTNAPRSTL
jgi:hypothetical protein